MGNKKIEGVAQLVTVLIISLELPTVFSRIWLLTMAFPDRQEMFMFPLYRHINE